MKIKQGSKVAIVGASGSGKTTLFNILVDFYPFNVGEIRYGGVFNAIKLRISSSQPLASIPDIFLLPFQKINSIACNGIFLPLFVQPWFNGSVWTYRYRINSKQFFQLFHLLSQAFVTVKDIKCFIALKDSALLTCCVYLLSPAFS